MNWALGDTYDSDVMQLWPLRIEPIAGYSPTIGRLVGMLSYSVLATLYLACLGFAGSLTGVLLWPVVVLHVILTALLIRDVTRTRRDLR